MPEITFSYEHVPTIRDFSRSNARVRGLMGPFGSGKSSGCVIELLRRAHEQAPGQDGIRRTRWAIVRNTYQQLRDTTITTFHQWLPPYLFGDWYKSEHRYVVNRIPGIHTEFLFRALDRPDQLGNLLSLELTGGWVNEAREVPWTIIKALMGRIDRYPAMKDGGASWAGLVLDTNPPDVDSWWYKFFEEDKPDLAEIFKQPSGVGPKAENLPNLAKDYYKHLHDLYKGDDAAIRVYIEGCYGYVQDGKPVYPEYNDLIHVAECSPIKGKPIVRGWDYGLTPSCVFTQLLPSGQWIIFDEMTSDNMSIDEFGDDVLAHCARHYKGYKFEDYGDPAGNERAPTDKRTCVEILRGKDISVQPGDQDLESRLGSVKKVLRVLIKGKPRFVLSPKCKKLRLGFQGRYKYKRVMVSEEKYRDLPDKNDYSHPQDALQYVATRLFGKEMRNTNRRKGPSPQPKVHVV